MDAKDDQVQEEVHREAAHQAEMILQDHQAFQEEQNHQAHHKDPD